LAVEALEGAHGLGAHRIAGLARETLVILEMFDLLLGLADGPDDGRVLVVPAVELFLTAEGEVLVNEVAPRPHNSGHYSIEAAYTNQFEQHLRAILDLPLGNTNSKVAGVMVNLVGAEGYQGDVIYENIEQILAMQGVTPHIYGKRETRPFRKMGHVTIVNKDIEKARTIAEKVKQTIKVISH